MSQKYKYAFLGTGVGKAAAYYAMTQPDTELVYITDVDFDRALAVANNLMTLTGNKVECRPRAYLDGGKLDVFDVDVFFSALPAKLNLPIVEYAIQNGKHYVDLGGILSVTERILKISKNRKISSTIAIDCGLSPGDGNIKADDLYHLLKDMKPNEDVEYIYVYVGGLPQKPQPPLFYQKVYSTEGHEHICYDDAYILKDGDVVTVPPFSGHETTHIPDLAKFSPDKTGLVECFYTAGSAKMPWILKNQKVKNGGEKTIRWPGFAKFISNVERKNFKDIIEPLVNIPVDKDNPDLVWMSVQGANKSMYASITMLDLHDPKTGFSAMERTTGFSAGIIATMAARDELRIGVFTAENVFLENQGRMDYMTEMRRIFRSIKYNIDYVQ